MLFRAVGIKMKLPKLEVMTAAYLTAAIVGGVATFQPYEASAAILSEICPSEKISAAKASLSKSDTYRSEAAPIISWSRSLLDKGYIHDSAIAFNSVKGPYFKWVDHFLKFKGIVDSTPCVEYELTAGEKEMVGLSVRFDNQVNFLYGKFHENGMSLDQLSQ